MNIRETQLDNGVTVITEQVPGYHSAAVGVWIDVGSRDEKPEVNGISHFYEHMVFKGNEHRSALEIVQEIESRGGYINAYTSKENTCVYAKVVKHDIDRATEIVCDMINSSEMDEKEIKKERQVIIEEIRSSEDTPDEMVHEFFSEAVWGGQPLAMPIAGTLKSVRGIGRSELLRHQKRVNTHSRIVVAAAGAVDHDRLLAIVTERLYKQKKAVKPKRSWKESAVKHIVRRRDIQQCHVVLGTQIQLKDDEEKLALYLFNVIFGDGMASRLFQKVREELGLVYSIYTSVDSYDNSYGFSVAFSSDEKGAHKTLEVVEREIALIVAEGVTEIELDFAKRSITGALLLKVESTTSRMTRLARQVIKDLPRESLDETVEKVLAVKPDALTRVINKLFQSQRWGSAAVVPKGVSLKVKQYLHF
ncbi:MAG: insulinase family protein [Fibrobacterales bacterium]